MAAVQQPGEYSWKHLSKPSSPTDIVAFYRSRIVQRALLQRVKRGLLQRIKNRTSFIVFLTSFYSKSFYPGLYEKSLKVKYILKFLRKFNGNINFIVQVYMNILELQWEFIRYLQNFNKSISV